MAQGTVSISIDQLRAGVTCRHPIEDDHGVFLLGANTTITGHVINGLRARGIQSIEVDPRDLATLRGAAKAKAAAARRERNPDALWSQSKSVKEMLVDRHDEGLSDERDEQLHDNLLRAKEHFADLEKEIVEEKIRSVTNLNGISDAYARLMVDDHDQTVCMMGRLNAAADPEKRSVRMSVLGMAIAIEMGLDGPQMLEVGMTALLHDVGLYAMGPRFRKPIEAMSEAELWEYRKHPLVSVLCVEDVMEVPASVQMAMQQVHEQFDGSGYPRGVKGQRIHTYARILNVVDAYLQLTTPTSDRPAIVPHDAIGLMLHQAGHGIFDPKVIRNFLNVETLFPLGSTVELNSGELAQVIRRPRDGFAEPVVQDSKGNRIELEANSIQIVRPVCDKETNEERLPAEVMQSSDWHPANHLSLV